MSSGGHPLPIVRREGGRAETVGKPGTLLGVMPDPKLRDTTLELSAGDAFVLYTDGVTEAGAPDRLLDPADLGDALARCPTTEQAELAACLERLAVETSAGEPQDDIAIVALQVRA
jgi:serine phosphatase RsbU (regulator of sigma subunit)